MTLLAPLVLLSLVQPFIAAQTVLTWPSPATDDLEDLMFLITGYRARNFADAITPCSKQSSGGSGPGRVASAEWLRTTFHDVATANNYTGTGGCDGSIQYELSRGENPGSAFTSTVTTYEPFFGPRIPLSEIIAIGTYAAVRGCGGPSIPVRPGRVDATSAGDTGVPQPQNDIGTFQNQFARLNMNTSEMIAVVACGHSLGGVHGKNFPQIVADPNGFESMDTSPSAFDERIATEYVSGNTTNPLVTGLSVQYKRNSDFVVNTADNNATIRTLTDPTVFRNICRTVLQKLIETVPSKKVTLSPNAITPYEVKPYGLQLYLQNGGANLTFAGDIRVRTTNRPASSITSVQLRYADRTGAASSSSISTTTSGTATGFDDSFTFYGFSASIPTSSSISSFTVIITHSDGTTESFNNNGAGFPVSDALLLQYRQSCSSDPSSITITAAVRNTTTGTPSLNFLGRRYTGPIVPKINTTTTPFPSSSSSIGGYTIYNLTLPLNATQSAKGHFNLTLPGSPSIDLALLSTLSSTCTPLLSTNTPTTPTNWTSLGCVTDPFPSTPRVLSGPQLYSSTAMTTASCAAFCSSYALFGLEYASQCFCGNALSASSANASASACNMPCTGDSSSTCGGPNALNLYANKLYTAPSSPGVPPGWQYSGCVSDSVSNRTLTGARVNDNSLTIARCAAVCESAAGGPFAYMGTEYSGECYCGNAIGGTGAPTDEGDCSMACSGNQAEMCGGPGRLSLYVRTGTNSSSTGTNQRRWSA